MNDTPKYGWMEEGIWIWKGPRTFDVRSPQCPLALRCIVSAMRIQPGFPDVDAVEDFLTHSNLPSLLRIRFLRKPESVGKYFSGRCVVTAENKFASGQMYEGSQIDVSVETARTFEIWCDRGDFFLVKHLASGDGELYITRHSFGTLDQQDQDSFQKVGCWRLNDHVFQRRDLLFGYHADPCSGCFGWTFTDVLFYT